MDLWNNKARESKMLSQLELGLENKMNVKVILSGGQRQAIALLMSAALIWMNIDQRQQS